MIARVFSVTAASAAAGSRLNGLGRGVEGVRRADHLVAGPHHQRLEREHDRIRPVGHRDRLAGAEGVGDLLLESAHVGAEDEPAGVDDVARGPLHVIEKMRVLAADVHQRDGHRDRLSRGRAAPTQ
jgi:hypothetical protein